MLSGFQTEVVAFYDGDATIVCYDCAVKQSSTVAISRAELGMDNSSGLEPLIRYTVESEFGEDGLYCDACTAEIVEPWNDDEEDADDD